MLGTQGMQGAYNKNWQRNTGMALVAGGLALAWVFNLSRRLEQRCPSPRAALKLCCEAAPSLPQRAPAVWRRCVLHTAEMWPASPLCEKEVPPAKTVVGL